MKTILKKIKKVLDFFDLTKHGYKVNKFLTNIPFVLMLFYFILTIIMTGVNPLEETIYIYCPEDVEGGICYNTMYEPFSYNDPIKSVEFLSAGESLGEYRETSIFFKTFTTLLFSSVILAFCINHSLYNKGFKFKKVEE